MFLHHRPIKTIITGKSGSGKTTYFERLLLNGFKSYWQTIFLYDWQGEMSERMKLEPTFEIEKLPSALETGFVCFDPSIEFEGNYENGLLFFADWTYEICKASDEAPPYPRLFSCDEIQLLTESSDMPPQLQRILQTGRRCGLDCAIVSQQLNELHNKFRSQTTERVCFQHEDPWVLSVLNKWGLNPEEVMGLETGEFVYRNDRGQTARQSMFSPSVDGDCSRKTIDKDGVDKGDQTGQIESG